MVEFGLKITKSSIRKFMSFFFLPLLVFATHGITIIEWLPKKVQEGNASFVFPSSIIIAYQLGSDMECAKGTLEAQ